MSTESIPFGYCHCGCGEKTKLVTHTNKSRGVRKGEPNKYLHGHHERKPDLDKAHLRADTQRRCKICGEWKDAQADFYRKSGYTCKLCRNNQIGGQRNGTTAAKAYRYKARYGLTLEAVEQMHLNQDNKCALCTEILKPNATALDHDHATGKARALLCFRCNAGLGMLKDDPSLLRKAARYVEEHRHPST